MKGIISAAAALSLALPLAAYAGAAGQLPAGWEIVSSDGEKVFHNTRSGIAVSAKTIPSEGAPLPDVAEEVARQKDCSVRDESGSFVLSCSGRTHIILEQSGERSLALLVVACGSAPEAVCRKDGTDFVRFLVSLGKQAAERD